MAKEELRRGSQTEPVRDGSCSWRPFQNAGYYSCGGSWQSHRGHFSSKWLSGKRIYLPLMFASREGSIFLHPNYHLPPSLLQDILALLLEYLSWNYVKYFKMISVYTTLAATITLYFPLYIFSVSNQSNFKKKNQIQNQTDCIQKTRSLLRYQVSQWDVWHRHCFLNILCRTKVFDGQNHDKTLNKTQTQTKRFLLERCGLIQLLAGEE